MDVKKILGFVGAFFIFGGLCFGAGYILDLGDLERARDAVNNITESNSKLARILEKEREANSRLTEQLDNLRSGVTNLEGLNNQQGKLASAISDTGKNIESGIKKLRKQLDTANARRSWGWPGNWFYCWEPLIRGE
jgi:uncharacterized phage infection (PIP) family protein YhgE